MCMCVCECMSVIACLSVVVNTQYVPLSADFA